MAEKEVIIWDMDGTLRSLSLIGLIKSYKAIIKYAGKNPSDFFTDDTVGFLKWFSSYWWDNMVSIGRTDAKFIEKAVKIFHEIYDSHIYLFPWVGATIPQLSSKYTQVILTSSNGASVAAFLQKSNPSLLPYFYIIVGNEQVKKIKPDPEGINLIKRQINNPSLGYIIIGDSHHDLQAGRSAGIQTGLVKWGGANNIEAGGQWENLKPDYIFEKPEDLLTLL